MFYDTRDKSTRRMDIVYSDMDKSYFFFYIFIDGKIGPEISHKKTKLSAPVGKLVRITIHYRITPAQNKY